MNTLPSDIFAPIICVVILIILALWFYNAWLSSNWAYKVKDEKICRCRHNDCRHVFIISRFEKEIHCPNCGKKLIQGLNQRF